MGEKAGVLWTVAKKPIYQKMAEGRFRPVPNQFALTRDSDSKVLSIVGSVYKPVQNIDGLEFFNEFVKAGDMSMETVGSLYGGRFVWVLARFKGGFSVGKGDRVESYLLLALPHFAGKSLLAQTTAIRVVCRNTLAMAVGEDFKGNAGAFRMPHTRNFTEEVKTQAKVTLTRANEQMQSFKSAAQLLASKKAEPEQVEEYFCEVIRFDPKKEGQRKPRILPKLQTALLEAPGQQLGTAMGTWWGAFNAVTNVIDFQRGRERDTAMASAWFGQGADDKRRALKLALDKAA
jgi:phage/plasmid-like protein (TIGR03299 family)